MRCQKCKQTASSITLPYLGLRLCKRCFCTLIIRRVKKDIRAQSLIDPRDRILLIDDGSVEARISESILNESYNRRLALVVIKKKRVSIDAVPTQLGSIIRAKKISTVILPWNLDDEVTHFIEHLVTDHDFKKVGNFNDTKQGVRYVKLLRTVLGSECLLFAQCTGLQSTRKRPANQLQKDIRAMLDATQAKHPETKFSLGKSIDGLRHRVLI